jgi:Cof subfamily protein (haloacid dehalogenase superfamily)
MIKLIALDLDGTIVNSQLEISERTIATLQRLQNEDDVKVVIATGRMFPSTIPFARTMGLTSPVISYQGAMIRDISQVIGNILEHPILFHRGIEMDTARELVDVIHKEGYHANLYVDDQLFTTHLNPHSRYYQNISGVVPQEARDLHRVLTGPPSKIMIIHDEDCGEIVDNLQRHFSAHVSVCRSRHNYCEIVHWDVSKWKALEQLMEIWDIRPEEVMAIGDQENDLSMITAAGVGVAMGNAPDNVKAQANYVTAPVDEDGVVAAVEKFVYGHMPLKDVSPPPAEKPHA